MNDFQQTSQPKTNYGIQTLFLIGLCDTLPTQEILNLLKNYIPFCIYTKLVKFCQLKNPNTFVSWTQIKQQLEKRNNLTQCADKLCDLLTSLTPNNNNCHIFHIGDNSSNSFGTEPTHNNTEAMVLDFITFIYRRNILASIVKYIILQDFIQKLTSSLFTSTHKGIFSQILLRLNEIIFETTLLSFNGSNYDNYLLMNPLILCLTKLKHKISLFKKGSSISTIKCTIKKNIQAKPNLKTKCDFISNLYIKDIRYMVAGHMSLDRIGQLFNIPFQKMIFPYERAVSIDALKNTHSLHPTDELFWNDTFKGQAPPLAERLKAQEFFENKLFRDLYQYNVYYLILDCLLLHSIVLTIFQTYLKDSINIFVRRNYSQSNLSFQELFIVQPSKQIERNLAPKRFSHPFLNYFTKRSVTGGLCTSFVHQNIDEQTIINSHLKYVNLDLDKKAWPNFQNHENFHFDKTPAGIVTLDIRSLYPSASCKPIPVHTPIIYTRLTLADLKKIPPYSSMLNIKSFCTEVQTNGNTKTDYFKLINKPPRFGEEFNAINYYLSTLPTNITIVRFQSNFTALGPCYFGHYPVDGLLSFIQNDLLYVHIIQYNSVFRHGHLSNCSIPNTEEQAILAKKTNLVEKNITELFLHLIEHFELKNVIFKYCSISECNFKHHQLPQNSKIICEFKRKYKYNTFLQNIIDKTLTGFIVVKNLELKHKNPLFGFIIQKASYGLKHLSSYTKDILHHFSQSERVISLNKSASFMIISTHYFLWLLKNFGFAKTPDIYHGVFFKFDHYLKHSIESKLAKRTHLKELIKKETDLTVKQNLEVQSELIKLCLNSCYGFTLCNLSSSKFKSFKNAQSLPRHKSKTSKILSSLKLAPNVFLNEYNNPRKGSFETILGHIGANILFFSKIILIKRLYFVLKHLNPTKSQLLYMDTDSAHILVCRENLVENIDEEFRQSFLQSFEKHFEKFKLAGIWVNEGFFTKAHYIGEKSYVLFNTETNKTISHMKGLNQRFQERFVNEKIDPSIFSCISYNIFQKTSDFVIFKTNMSKNLFQNYVPIKRYFVCASGSLPLKIDD